MNKTRRNGLESSSRARVPRPVRPCFRVGEHRPQAARPSLWCAPGSHGRRVRTCLDAISFPNLARRPAFFGQRPLTGVVYIRILQAAEDRCKHNQEPSVTQGKIESGISLETISTKRYGKCSTVWSTPTGSHGANIYNPFILHRKGPSWAADWPPRDGKPPSWGAKWPSSCALFGTSCCVIIDGCAGCRMVYGKLPFNGHFYSHGRYKAPISQQHKCYVQNTVFKLSSCFTKGGENWVFGDRC